MFGSSPGSDTLPLGSKGGAASNVLMVDDGLTQCDSDVVIEEEQEEEMDTSAPSDPIIPIPPEESPMLQGSEVEDGPLDEDSEDTSLTSCNGLFDQFVNFVC